MIAKFPEFSQLTRQDKIFLDEFNSRYTPYADWTYGALRVWWDSYHDLRLSQLDNNLIIYSSYPSLGKEKQFCLLGSTNVDSTLNELFAYQTEHGYETAVYSVPEYTIQAIDHLDRFQILEDHNAAEYVIATKMHAYLEGNIMYGIRRRLSRFKKSIGNINPQTKSIDLAIAENRVLLEKALQGWKLSYKNDLELTEQTALHTTFDTAEELGLLCLGLFIEGTLIGFALYRRLNATSVGVGHIKVSPTHIHTFGYMIHALSQYLQKEGIEFLNMEQDLGIEGLRRYKHSLRPVHMMRKFTVFPIGASRSYTHTPPSL